MPLLVVRWIKLNKRCNKSHENSVEMALQLGSVPVLFAVHEADRNVSRRRRKE